MKIIFCPKNDFLERNIYMATANDIIFPVYELVGQSLTDIGVHHEILILRFGEYEIHVTCFARILHNNEILLSTQDYHSWDGKECRRNDMYRNIAIHGASLIGQTVRSIDVSPVNDLFVVMGNGARIELYNSNGNLCLTEYAEQWFFYKPKDSTYPYLSISNMGIEREQKES